MICRRTCFIFSLFPILVFLTCSKPQEKSIRDLAHEYNAASNAHDLDKLASMTADSAVWILGNLELQGKENVLGPNRYDAGTKARLTMSNLTASGDTAKFELVEESDVLRPLGIDSIVHYPLFIFKDEKVEKKDHWKLSVVFPNEAAPNLGKFHKWIRDNYPDAIKRLFDANGNFVFSRENGGLMVDLAREFSDKRE